MTTEPASSGELAARAAKPPVVRLRRGATLALVLAALALLAGAFCWSFVVAPRLKAAAAPPAQEAPAKSAPNARPVELISAQPATYDRLKLADLPPPRSLGQAPKSEPATSPSRAPAPARRDTPEGIHARQAQARTSGLFFQNSTTDHAQARQAMSTDARPMGAPLARQVLAAGTLLPATLLTAIDTSRPGPVIGVVSAGVFDTATGRRLLVPQGSRLVGRHEGAARHGEHRAIITWRNLTLPGGQSYALADEPGVDAEGAVGVPGRVERRLGQLSLATAFAGAITTLGQFARDRSDSEGSFVGNAGDAAAIEAAQVGGRLIDRELDVARSVRLSAGAQVHVLLTRDLVLEGHAP